MHVDRIAMLQMDKGLPKRSGTDIGEEEEEEEEEEEDKFIWNFKRARRPNLIVARLYCVTARPKKGGPSIKVF